MNQQALQPYTASLFNLTGKVAIVTGATGRLGREISFALAEMGANLVIIARSQENLSSLQKDIEQSTKSHVLAIAEDVQNYKSVGNVIDKTWQTYAQLDILVNNVTGNSSQNVEDMTDGTFDEVFHQIVTGMFICCKEAGKAMSEQGSGSIINIASIYGMVAADKRIYGDSGFNSSVVYGAGKGAVLQLTRYLAAYWADKGIRVNAITPGGVEDATNDHSEFRANYKSRTPMQRMMQREEIRGAVVFLASEASSYVTGHNLVVDGGFTTI